MTMRLAKNFFLLALCLFQGFAHADLVGTFRQLEKKSKGPFSLNSLQGVSDRVPVTGPPPAHVQFQAAYRNEIAQELAKQYDFYVGNLFTTNYYELMGEYVYNGAQSHALDHQALLKNPAAFPKATSMVRNWVLEKYYIKAFPKTTLSKSFNYRGISGSEFEQPYAAYFFNYYLNSMTAEFQFLPVVLLAKEGPLSSSNSLDKARNLIGTHYDHLAALLPEKDPMLLRLYNIRNMIHNHLSPQTLKEIEKFLIDFPSYQASGYTELAQIRDILRSYFSYGADKIAAQAQKLGEARIKAAAQKMSRGATVAGLLELSQGLADLKTRFATKTLTTDHKVEALQLLINTSSYLNKEVTSLSRVDSKDVILVVLNTIYAEGFLLKDNWEYFAKELARAGDVSKAAQSLPDLIEVASESLNQAFTPAFAQWKKVEPKMLNFTDDVLKSSAVNSASLVAQKIKR